jgi:hypothetical protein
MVDLGGDRSGLHTHFFADSLVFESLVELFANSMDGPWGRTPTMFTAVSQSFGGVSVAETAG